MLEPTQFYGGHVHTISDAVLPNRRRRRIHSPEFKAQVVAACKAPGVSIAAVAMANGIDANLARRWMLDLDKRGGSGAQKVSGSTVTKSFVAALLPPAKSVHPDIRIELHRGATVINVNWPIDAASEFAAWMRELLR